MSQIVTSLSHTVDLHVFEKHGDKFDVVAKIPYQISYVKQVNKSFTFDIYVNGVKTSRKISTSQNKRGFKYNPIKINIGKAIFDYKSKVYNNQRFTDPMLTAIDGYDQHVFNTHVFPIKKLDKRDLLTQLNLI